MLGLECIWIVSICVIQKDETDWEKEATRMFEYFSNAHVTLGSTFGVDSTRGFLSGRHIEASTLCLLDMIFRGRQAGASTPKRYVGEVSLLLDVYDTNPTPRVCLTSIMGPARCSSVLGRTKSDLVSSRLLLFTQYQILYECYAQRHLLGLWGDPVARTLKSAYKLFAPTHPRKNIYVDCARVTCTPATPGAPPTWRPRGPEASVPRLTEYDRLLFFFAERGHSTITFKGEDLTFTQAGRFGRALGGYIVVQGPVLDCILPLTLYKGDDLDCSFGGGQELLLQDGRKIANLKFQPDFERGYQELEADDGSSTGDVIVYLL
ncbi:hypothetical protein PFICI_00544 [Pestalotiopsis fici W106-1]|uniref:Heterokaryon incompatibility domain-containing protein n=1 Tax=Pestalotiopsis fici (strain W106-1 / CGMCC3.15140) TaxID=1229662 RepID=W3XN80_PESFW|nr:uncharacterized protein PFICI_00544 [Pestalotiopsis fici W106-1]ETS86716.1 hypothetical protein PFICI_00544 [Pestalotiopsis fici W106-1]